MKKGNFIGQPVMRIIAVCVCCCGCDRFGCKRQVDGEMQAHLSKRYAAPLADQRYYLVPHDIRKVFDNAIDLVAQVPAVCVGNIPYSISSDIVRGVVSSWFPITRVCVLLVQEEFAKKIASSPGTEGYGPLAAYIGLLAKVEVMNKVKKQLFEPIPKVDSAVVRITPLTESTSNSSRNQAPKDDVHTQRKELCQRLERFVNLCFTKANKTLKSIFNSAGPQEYFIRCLEHTIERTGDDGGKIDVHAFEADKYGYVKQITESILGQLDLTNHRARHVKTLVLQKLFQSFVDYGVHFDVSIAERTRQRYSSNPKRKS